MWNIKYSISTKTNSGALFMLNIKFTHSSSSSQSSTKQFVFTLADGATVSERVPPQAQQIILLTYALSLEQPIFSYNDIISYIDECCAYNGTIFTRSKGGTERIVRYYAKLLQEIGAITNINDVEPTDAE